MRIFYFLCLFLSQLLLAQESIGKAMAVEGLVKALSGENAERILAKGSDIFAQETIVVGSSSRLQIRFTDGGVVNLIPDTEYRISSYRYKKAAQKDQSFAELFKGGFRALSGSIAKKNPQGYEVKTPSSTIGLRGTLVEVLIKDEETYYGVEKGKALIWNEAGSQMIGAGQKANFALVPGKTTPPELLLERPNELMLGVFAPPAGGTTFESAQIQQQRQAAPPSQEPSVPSSLPSTAPAGAPDASTGGVPSIGETEDSGDWEFQPTGSGASIQGGC